MKTIQNQHTSMIFKPHTVRLHSVAHLSVGFSPGYPVLIGCYKSCDVRIIDDIIVSCQQGQMIQHV